VPPNGLELSCPAEAGGCPPILARAGGPGALPYGPARRVSFSELLGGVETSIHPVWGVAVYSRTDVVLLNWAENPKADGMPIGVTKSLCVLRLC